MFLQYLPVVSSRGKQLYLYLFNNNSELCQRNKTDITILKRARTHTQNADIYFTFNICVQVDSINKSIGPKAGFKLISHHIVLIARQPRNFSALIGGTIQSQTPPKLSF